MLVYLDYLYTKCRNNKFLYSAKKIFPTSSLHDSCFKVVLANSLLYITVINLCNIKYHMLHNGLMVHTTLNYLT